MGLVQPAPETGLVKPVDANIIVTTFAKLQGLARGRSLWPFGYGLACCAIEMVATGAAHYDLSRFGYEVFRPSPRQADLMIVAGTVTKKMAPRLQRLYAEMPEPKFVVAMGACAVSGGEFWDSYHVVQGVDTLVPVDVYIPGCPPRPEELLEGLLKLRDKVEKQGFYRPYVESEA
jgi:NADH-quinone oxidoreductase subunit B